MTENGIQARRMARSAGLRYCTDDRPGTRRRRCGRGFSYIDANGDTIRDARERKRIQALAIPPAWSDVWICPHPRGHLQATGRDERGRKQYIYHPRWRDARDEAKFGRMIDFAAALPRLRRRVDRDLRRRGLPREKVLAAVVRLLDATGLRIGNKRYQRDNETFGLTTLRRRHLEIDGSAIRICFRGKGGKEIETTMSDRRLAGILLQCNEVRGYELFRYLDDEARPHDVDAADVNEYVRVAARDDFTAKDFRTWKGTVLALCHLQAIISANGDGNPESQIVQAVDLVAEELSNTRTVCRASYIHPGVLDAHLEGWLAEALGDAFPPSDEGALAGEEMALLQLLRRIEGRSGP